MKEMRFGLVGAGAVAESHITGIKNTPRARLAAICKKNKSGAEELEKKYSVPCFTSIEDMLPIVDAVDIITPSGLHLEPALRAIEAGKHVLVEKPMEITAERIDRMIEAAESKKVKLGCVFQVRFKPLTRRVKELVEGGILGEIYSGSAYCKLYRTQEYYDSGGWRGTWELDGGGCLMNQGIHNIDFLLWNMGDAVEVIGLAESKARESVEVETIASALIKFKNGATGVVESTTLAYPGYPERLEIFGSRGTIALTADTSGRDEIITFELTDPSPEELEAKKELMHIQQTSGKKLLEVSRKDSGTVVTGRDQGHGPIIEDFVNAALTGNEPFITGREARKSVALINAIYESSGNGSKPVKPS